jgi:hypothetical protein
MFKLLSLGYCLLGWGGAATPPLGQPISCPGTPRVAQLPADSSRRVVLTTGKLKPASFWELSPGGSYALRFVPPAAGQYALASI